MKIVFKKPYVSISIDENGTIISCSEEAHAHLEGCTIINLSTVRMDPSEPLELIDIDGERKRVKWPVSFMLDSEMEGAAYDF